MHRILEGIDAGGKAQEGYGEEKVKAFGETGTADVRGRVRNIGACMDDNGPHLEREGGG